MSEIKLMELSAEYEEQIAHYRAEFPTECERVTYDPNRIPGMDYLEKYDSVSEWIQFCENMSDKLTWYMAIRESDSKIVGFIVFRHRLEYDDDDIAFASNFGYSVCPSERGKGYAKEMLRLGLLIAKEFGLDKVRIVCRDINIGSNKTILANGGVYIDMIHGEKSGLNVNRYDIRLDMNFKLIRLRTEDLIPYKKDMQEAFQQGAINGFGEMDEEILPESHIDRSLTTKGAIAYEALVDGKMVGGAIVVIDEKTKHNHLDFLYVKYGTQSKGVGQAIWKAIEEKHPETEVWETVTPYFEKRNVHFYINCCGFHVVEFFNKYHPDPNDSDEVDELFENEYFDGMFRFEKVMK